LELIPNARVELCLVFKWVFFLFLVDLLGSEFPKHDDEQALRSEVGEGDK
jgi:hypothetical protein